MNFVCYFDAKNWKVLRVFSLGGGLKLRVGFESHSPEGNRMEVLFSEIHYSLKKIADIYSDVSF